MTMGKTRFSEDGRRAVSQAQRKRWADPLRSSESAIQEAIFEHYRHRRRPGAVMFHVPNGGLRPSHVGAKLRAQGVQPGARLPPTPPCLSASGQACCLREFIIKKSAQFGPGVIDIDQSDSCSFV